MPVSLPTRSVPLWLKLAYTAFVAVMVPYYWVSYGPTNFLYFCDVAVFFTFVAIWTESPLLASMPAVGILMPQILWMVDFAIVALGFDGLGMTAYMFDSSKSLIPRGLSLFHMWLPILLVWLVWRLGYDRRAVWMWTAVAWILLVICYFFMPPPSHFSLRNPNIAVNINYVYGFDDNEAQTWMSANLWFALVMVGLPLLIFLPTHLVLLSAFGRRTRQALDTDGKENELAGRASDGKRP